MPRLDLQVDAPPGLGFELRRGYVSFGVWGACCVLWKGLTKFRLMRPCRVDTTTVAGTLGVPGGGMAGDSATTARSRLIAPWRVRKEALMSEVPRPSLPQARLRFLRCLRSVLGTGPTDGSVGSMRYVPARLGVSRRVL